MGKLYDYVGPEEKRASASPTRCCIDSAEALQDWMRLQPARGDSIPATFIVDETGRLWLADRRSEHVACAAGRPVLGAGELFFDLTTAPRVAEASNQSTGYCPEPESWSALAAALDRLGIPHPGGFTQVCHFRRCSACGQRNIVKEADSTCAVCGAELP
ncbi:MAG: hypothetical protein AB7K24_33730, partial [Gemmataceae bacterium]